jgi:putative ABC transport system permease protein
MASTFAALALLIAAIGLYGLISYTAARRTQEIGIRSAIGAAPQDLVRMIVRESLFTIVAGLSFGLALSITATRWIASLLFDVRAVDPLSIAAAMTLLAGIAFVAAWIPARRVARTDPMIALRCE